MSDLCPCGSGLAFEACCEPFLIERKKPKTAAALMRSRYCAYAMGSVDYLYKTSGPKVRKEFDAESSRNLFYGLALGLLAAGVTVQIAF